MSNFNKHIIIVGTARSGTSWLAETIAQQHRYRILFEPEHETQTKYGHLLCDKWITSKQEAIPAHNYLKRVFCNTVNSDWIAQNSNRTFKRHLWPFIPKKYVIKFVRANLLGMYIKTEFNIPVIHIIRNPYDVISSQQKVKFPWLYDLSHFAKQEKLVGLIKVTYNIDIRKTEDLSEIELLAMRWCIENMIPLDCIEDYQNTIEVIKYEDLISDIHVFYKLCRDYNLDPIKNIEDKYRIPSSKTHFKSNTITGKNDVNLWTTSDLIEVNQILDKFNSSLYPRKS